jgi:Leucine-rich repeat (LRR) protein
MSSFNIENYLNSLNEEITTIDVAYKNINYLPDITRFKNLRILICHCNILTTLPTLPENLQELYCQCNALTSLPTLPQNLKIMVCHTNQLAALPALPETLKKLSCDSNQLTSLPEELYDFDSETDDYYGGRKIIRRKSRKNIRRNFVL